jgi:hypothetical protein
MVADMTPERIDQIRELESQVKATFFHGRGGEGMIGIDGVVKWSRTKYGGKEHEPFFEPDRTGCMRWGLCDF